MKLKTFKYRLYPNKEQKQFLEKHFGCVRFVYNWALDKKKNQYEQNKNSLSCFDLINELTKLKQQEEYKWLNEVNSQSLQQSIRNLDNAFQKFFREKKGYPKFKSKKNSRKSFQVPQFAKVDFENNYLTIPKIPEIKSVFHRKFGGKIKTVTISKTPTNKYYASILVEFDEQLPEPKPIQKETTIGIDLGISSFATLSDGRIIENPKNLKKSLKQLKRLQRQSNRRVVGSNNRKKANLKVAKLHEKITNRRDDFLHKLTYQLTHENQVDTLALETLIVSNMIKNHNLAQAISDVSWSKFNKFLEYKAKWYGKNIIRADRFDPSSRKCSCGFVNTELKLSDRTWIYPMCFSINQRDNLASKNIKDFALESIGLGRPEFTLVENAWHS
jgi:putative transposase